MDLVIILQKKYAGSQWKLVGDDYAGLEWLSDTAKPTKTDLDALWPEVEAEIAAQAQAKADARASAIAKLEALGLTLDEVSAAFGLEFST